MLLPLLSLLSLIKNTMSMWRATSALQLSRAIRSSRAKWPRGLASATNTNSEGRARYARWVEEIRSTAEPADASSEPCSAAEGAPFLNEVDSLARRLTVYRRPPRISASDVSSSSLHDSMLSVYYPFSKDERLRTAFSDPDDKTSAYTRSFRLGKFYEAVDAVTADVAYFHCSSQFGGDREAVTLVTAGHYHSRKIDESDLRNDHVLRSYITRTGGASLEVRTDCHEISGDSG